MFVLALARKMLNFPPEVVIWWTLRIYFREAVNRLSELSIVVSFFTAYNASNLVLEIF